MRKLDLSLSVSLILQELAAALDFQSYRTVLRGIETVAPQGDVDNKCDRDHTGWSSGYQVFKEGQR